MIIRNNQLEIFSVNAQQDFEKRLLAHVHENFPEECSNLTHKEVKEIIDFGISQAQVYGFDTEINICRFVDLLFMLDTDFDTNSEFDWTREILVDDTFATQDAKMNSLYNEIENKCADEQK